MLITQSTARPLLESVSRSYISADRPITQPVGFQKSGLVLLIFWLD